MKRNILSIVLLILLAAVLYVLLTKFKPQNEPQVSTQTESNSQVAQLLQGTNTGSTDTGSTEVSIDNLAALDYAGGGEYKPFFPQTVKQALADGKNIILFFYADRDPTDKALDSDLQKRVDRIPADTIIMRVDYDKNTDLKKTFSVTQQNTLIFLNKEGTESRRRSMGITSLSQIVRTIRDK